MAGLIVEIPVLNDQEVSAFDGATAENAGFFLQDWHEDTLYRWVWQDANGVTLFGFVLEDGDKEGVFYTETPRLFKFLFMYEDTEC